MNTDELIERLRQAAAECSSWDNDMNPPYTDWSYLLDEAADKIERLKLVVLANDPGEPSW